MAGKNVKKRNVKVQQKKKKRELKKKELQELQTQAYKEIQEEKVATDQQTVQAIKEQLRSEPRIVAKDLDMLYSFAADRNGAGYFRTVWPLELCQTYLGKAGSVWQTYIYEASALLVAKVIRFQRQCTNTQKQAFDFYDRMRNVNGCNYKLVYELDDALNDIEPYNEIAYKFYTDELQTNAIEIMKRCDMVTFSTDYLKKLYVEKYGLEAEKVQVFKNHLPQFLWNKPTRQMVDLKGRKPRVIWWGSASHIFKGGDLEFLLPLIRKTVDEYQWVFAGCYPKELEDLKMEGKIETHPWVPVYALANFLFYNLRPDICIAPIKDNTFNKCKSDLKLLEGAALGIPVITSAFPDSPYNDLSLANIENECDVWKSMIDFIVNDPNEYMNIVKMQYRDIRANRWMEYHLKDSWATLWDDNAYAGANTTAPLGFNTPLVGSGRGPLQNVSSLTGLSEVQGGKSLQEVAKKPTIEIIEP